MDGTNNGTPEPTPTMLSSLRHVLNGRASVRGFLDRAVPDDVIASIAEAAQLTPSWCNTQPWGVHVTRGAATDRLRKAIAADGQFAPDFEFPVSYEGSWAERRREVGWQLYDAVGVAKGDRDASAREMLRNFEFFGAPHVAIVTVPASLGVYALVDAGAYVQSFMLAAHAAGLATCPQAAVAAKAPVLREFFGLDESELVVCGIAFGYADPDHPANSFRATRVPVDEAVDFVD